MKKFSLNCLVYSNIEPALFGFLQLLNLRFYGDRRKLILLIEKAAYLSEDALRSYRLPERKKERDHSAKSFRRIQVSIKQSDGDSIRAALDSSGMASLRPAEIVFRLEVAASLLSQPTVEQPMSQALPPEVPSELAQPTSRPTADTSSTSDPLAPPRSIEVPEHVAGVIGSVKSTKNVNEIPFDALEDFFQ